jgi:hypothetical protein
MSKLKRIISSILAASSSLAFAGSMGPVCTPNNLSMPCASSAWEVSALALYLHPSFGGNGLGYTSFSNYGFDYAGNPTVNNGAPNYLSNITPQWAWGFQVEGAYHFNTGNDLDVNWYHLSENTTGYLPNGNLFAGSAPGLYAGKIVVSPRWDAVNVEFGQHIDFDARKMLRLHEGVEFARVQTTFTNYPQASASGSPLFVTTDVISYNGFGPRLGADFGYLIGSGFSVYAKTAGSLLVGTAKQNVSGYSNYTYDPPFGIAYFTTGNYVQSNKGIVVPELESKLGLKWDYLIPQGNLGLDLGYMWIDYFNSLVSQVGVGIESSAISSSTQANFNLNGLYFGAKWTGNL